MISRASGPRAIAFEHAVHRLLGVLVLIPLLLHSASLRAAPAMDGSIEVVELHYRPAEELIPMLQPLVGEAGAVTGRGFQLIIKSPAAELGQIKSIVAQLDRAPKQLLITVEQVADHALTQRGSAVSGSVDLRVHSTQDHNESTLRQTLRVMEGQEAFISTGQDVPVAESAPVMRDAEVLSPGGVDYRSIRSGFIVLPRVNGDVATLTITPQRMRQRVDQGGAIDVQAASTTLSGQLEEWIELGAVENRERVDENTIVRSTARERSSVQRWRFHIRVLEP